MSRTLVAVLAGLLVWLPGAAYGIGDAERRVARVNLPPADDFGPTWSADGTRIFFSTTRRDFGIATVSADGTDERKVLDLDDHSLNLISPALSPDGAWIAFTVGFGFDRRPGLWTSRADGTDAMFLRAAIETPAWSPGSRRLAFAAADGLWVVDRDGGGLEQLALRGASSPTWSPDGAWIAFSFHPSVGSPEEPRLMAVSSSGGVARPLVQGPGARFPTWSPDGRLIAFTYDPLGPPGVDHAAVVRPDGTGLQVFSRSGVRVHAWMPGSRRLVLSGDGLLLLDIQSEAVRRITGHGHTPSVSPDGLRIAFGGNGECAFRQGIYVVKVDGAKLRRLTNHCRVVGTPGPDELRGTRWVEALLGLGGDDRLYAAGGGDSLSGGAGDDVLVGYRRSDRLDGGSGDDNLRGHSGEDRLVGGPGRDYLFGGDGRDRIFARDGERDIVICGRVSEAVGRDRVWADRVDFVSRDCELVYRPQR